MDFSSEHYVRLYTRDSPTWLRLGWDGQCMLAMLLRRAFPTGAIDIGELPPWEAAVTMCGAPPEQAQRGVAKLLEFGCVVHEGSRLTFPRFVAANKAAKSGAQRAREFRARRAVTKRDASVTKRDEAVTNVTTRNDASRYASQNVTPSNGVHRSIGAIGHIWYAEVLGRDDYPAGGKWDRAYEQIGAKPDSEKRDVARTIQRQLGKPDARRIMNPRHIADYWAGYAEGKPPGAFARNGDGAPLPGAAEVAAAKQAFDALYTRYRAAPTGEGKSALMAELTEADKTLKATKARFQWTE